MISPFTGDRGLVNASHICVVQVINGMGGMQDNETEPFQSLLRRCLHSRCVFQAPPVWQVAHLQGYSSESGNSLCSELPAGWLVTLSLPCY
jgi:hypothetical protein